MLAFRSQVLALVLLCLNLDSKLAYRLHMYVRECD
jgi:hypothetical protein